MNLLKKFTEEARDVFDLSEKSVLVALSGGKDSVALLSLFAKVREELSIKVYAAHFNHKIRGDEALRDARYAKELSEKLGVPFFYGEGDVPAFAEENGLGEEEAARIKRYEFLEKVKKEEKIDYIATAHTLSDNSETVLYNIARGSGIKGVAGIPKRRGDIIRPLLFATSEDILGYLGEAKLEYKLDSTNLDTNYSRNFIRHEVLPLIESKFPHFGRNCKRLSENASEESDFMKFAALEAEKKLCDSRGFLLERVIPLARREETRALIYHLVLLRLSPFGISVTRERADSLRRFLSAENKGKKLEVGSGVYLVSDGVHAFFFKGVKKSEVKEYEITLREGKNILPTGVEVTITSEKNDFVNNLSKKIYLNPATIQGVIKVRNRRPGDKYRAGNMTRNIKKYFIDRKFPCETKARVPIFTDECGIIWVPGLPPADRVKTAPNEKALMIYTDWSDETQNEKEQ